MNSCLIIYLLMIAFSTTFTVAKNYYDLYKYTKYDEYRFQVQCQQKVKANAEDMKVLQIYQQMPKSRKQFCLLGCYYKKVGLFGPGNYLNYDKAIEDIEIVQYNHKSLYKKILYIVKECMRIVKPHRDECIAAEQYFTCVLIGSSKMKNKI